MWGICLFTTLHDKKKGLSGHQRELLAGFLMMLKEDNTRNSTNIFYFSLFIMTNTLARKRVRSPLKWAGGKYQILDKIGKYLPKGGRLVDPFVGSAVTFLNFDYDEYYLNDINRDLINLYKAIKAEQREFIEYAKSYFTPANCSENRYYKFREIFNNTDDVMEKSAILLYLNRHGYNGLYRVNGSGVFNTPWSHRLKPPYFPEKELYLFAEKAKKAVFRCMDFEKVMQRTKFGDRCYADPPYIAYSRTANFTAYDAGGFTLEQHKRLAVLATELYQKGIPVLISNHYTPLTKKLYQSARKYKFPVQRMISCNGTNRGKVMEVLAVFK